MEFDESHHDYQQCLAECDGAAVPEKGHAVHRGCCRQFGRHCRDGSQGHPQSVHLGRLWLLCSEHPALAGSAVQGGSELRVSVLEHRVHRGRVCGILFPG